MKTTASTRLKLLDLALCQAPHTPLLLDQLYKTSINEQSYTIAMKHFQNSLYQDANRGDLYRYFTLCRLSNQWDSLPYQIERAFCQSSATHNLPLWNTALSIKAYIDHYMKRTFTTSTSQLFNIKRDIYSEHIALNPSMNQDIISTLQRSTTRHYEPKGQSTRKGDVIGFKWSDTETLSQLHSMIHTHLKRYMRRLQQHHPMMNHSSSAQSSHPWAISFTNGEHQISHIHPEGYISGIYYLINSHTKHSAGHLIMGSAPRDFIPVWDTHTITPTEGMLVLFPSYYFHSTTPTDQHQKRLSIAFDYYLK